MNFYNVFSIKALKFFCTNLAFAVLGKHLEVLLNDVKNLL